MLINVGREYMAEATKAAEAQSRLQAAGIKNMMCKWFLSRYVIAQCANAEEERKAELILRPSRGVRAVDLEHAEVRKDR